MYFSANELYSYALNDYYMRQQIEAAVGTFSRTSTKKFLAVVKDHLIRREMDVSRLDGENRDRWGYDRYALGLYKWARPWDVAPKCIPQNLADGEILVGVEVEMGFNRREDASSIAKIIADWKYVAIDYEGPSHPIEATFAPIKYSKFNGTCQAQRYIKLLREREDIRYKHSPDEHVGTHVNVSIEGKNICYDSLYFINDVLEYDLTNEEKEQYFGRRDPYGYLYYYGDSYLEFKLFNSTTDLKQFKRYVHVAVELAKLVYSEGVTKEEVYAALDRGYKKVR